MRMSDVQGIKSELIINNWRRQLKSLKFLKIQIHRINVYLLKMYCVSMVNDLTVQHLCPPRYP